VRGLLHEFGIVIPPVPATLCPPSAPSSKTPTPACLACSCRPRPRRPREIRELEGRIRVVARHLDAVAEQVPVVGRLRSIPGIRLLTATALLTAVADVQRFPSGRHFASHLVTS
jgi:hypothetical protein